MHATLLDLVVDELHLRHDRVVHGVVPVLPVVRLAYHASQVVHAEREVRLAALARILDEAHEAVDERFVEADDVQMLRLVHETFGLVRKRAKAGCREEGGLANLALCHGKHLHEVTATVAEVGEFGCGHAYSQGGVVLPSVGCQLVTGVPSSNVMPMVPALPLRHTSRYGQATRAFPMSRVQLVMRRSA